MRPSTTVEVAYPKAGLLRAVTDEERAAYQRDGAARLAGIIPHDWVDYMGEAIMRMLDRSDPSSQSYGDMDSPRFFGQSFPWLLDDAFKAWALYGPPKEVARQVLTDAVSLNFFYDQIFVKEPGAPKPTLWHQDFPYFPLEGEQILRIWVPFDRVTDDGGAVHYLRGSHKWGVVYRTPWSKAMSPYQPDFDAEYLNYKWLIGEAEPGDALLHHPKTVHGARGNKTNNFRRALTTVYTGDDVTWNPHSGNMFNNKDQTGHVTVPPELTPGGPIGCDLFPQVWPELRGPTIDSSPILIEKSRHGEPP
jgi:Phytanoyl-CoA dioxygenase (PhyH)